MNNLDNQQALLTFRVGPVLCCAPSVCVDAIISPPKLHHPPGTDTAEPGIFRHANSIVKVIDLRQKFGIDTEDQSQPGNIIITEVDTARGGENIGFWVDQIFDVFEFPAEGWGPLPAYLPRGIFSRTLLLKKQIHLYSEFEKLANIEGQGYLRKYVQHLKQQNETADKNPAEVNSTKAMPASTTAIKSDVAENPAAARLTQEKTTSTVAPSVSVSTSQEQTGVANDGASEDNKAHTRSENDEHFEKITKPSQQSITSQPVDTLVSPRARKTTAALAKSAPQNNMTTVAKDKTPGINSSASSPSTLTRTSLNTAPQQSPATKVKKTTKPAHQSQQAKTSSKATQNSAHPQQENNDGSVGMAIFMLFTIILLFGGGGYYLFNLLLMPTKVIHTPAIETLPGIEMEDLNSGYTEVDNQPDTELQTETNSVLAQENIVPPGTNISTADDNSATATTSEYRAEISQQNDEITIEIHQPENTPSQINKENIPESVTTAAATPAESHPVEATPLQAEKIEDINLESKIVEVKPVEQIEKIEPLKNEKIIKEVIHVVVKGDTLWAIAKRYVNNPFLYPELARLSKIKNPHRIYPGNRVRIRFVNY